MTTMRKTQSSSPPPARDPSTASSASEIALSIDNTPNTGVTPLPPPKSTPTEGLSLSRERSGASGRKHRCYYFPDGNVVFLVERTLYKVHRYFFQRDSSVFVSMFADTVAKQGRGSNDDDPLPLVDVMTKDFDCFLSILYPDDFRIRTVTTPEEWVSILELAARWGFESIKLLAIEHLAQYDSPIDKIVLGRKYGIVEWLGGAYEAVCRRNGPLTHEEGIRLGMEDVIRISAVRQTYGITTPRYDPKLLSGDLPKIFSLDKMRGQRHPASGSYPEVKTAGDQVVFQSIEQPKRSLSASSIGTTDHGGPPEVRLADAEIKPAEEQLPIKAWNKMRKKRDSQRKLEEQQRQARKQARREQAEREIQERRQEEEQGRQGKEGFSLLKFV